ncbi:MAG TPA: MazG family protein, partial [Candidatus Acidoferrales bacterium]|nr:MazG family protein [Candidatus Acidoferrales bacterium]
MSPRKPRCKSEKKPSARISRRRHASNKRRAPGVLFEDLLALQARLRAPGGCPWDREQTHTSLRTFLLEETHEVLDAMDSGDPRKFSSELGDLLLQIIFHALIASESGQFDIRDVIEAIHTKMVRRHPHVFGDVKAKTSAQVLKNWEKLKAEERRSESGEGKREQKPESILSAVPRALPALMEAHQLTRRAANIGFDW